MVFSKAARNFRTQSRSAKKRVHLAIERLEQRRLFAVLTVDSTADTDTRDFVLTLREAINLVNGTDPLAGVTIAEGGADRSHSAAGHE